MPILGKAGLALAMGTRTVAAMAIVAAIVDLILIAVVLLAASDVDQLTAPMSAHVDDRFGFLTGVSAFSAGVGALALACAARPFITGARAALGLALLGIFGVAKVFQAFFPLDAADAATTAAGHHSSLTIARPPGLAARTMSTCIIAAHTPTRSIDALTPL